MYSISCGTIWLSHRPSTVLRISAAFMGDCGIRGWLKFTPFAEDAGRYSSMPVSAPGCRPLRRAGRAAEILELAQAIVRAGFHLLRRPVPRHPDGHGHAGQGPLGAALVPDTAVDVVARHQPGQLVAVAGVVPAQEMRISPATGSSPTGAPVAGRQLAAQPVLLLHAQRRRSARLGPAVDLAQRGQVNQPRRCRHQHQQQDQRGEQPSQRRSAQCPPALSPYSSFSRWSRPQPWR